MRRFREHLRLARELAARVAAHDRLALFAPAPFGLVCVVHADGDEATRAMIAAVERAPDLAVTASEHDGRAYLRLSVGQTTTSAAHVDRLWDVLAAAAAP